MRQWSLERKINISKITQLVRDEAFDLCLPVYKVHGFDHWAFLIFQLFIPFLFQDIHILNEAIPFILKKFKNIYWPHQVLVAAHGI